jgi:hypothetical protein
MQADDMLTSFEPWAFRGFSVKVLSAHRKSWLSYEVLKAVNIKIIFFGV